MGLLGVQSTIGSGLRLILPRTEATHGLDYCKALGAFLAEMLGDDAASQRQPSGASAQHASNATSAPQSGKKTTRPRRSARRPIRYTQFFESFDEEAEEEKSLRSDFEAWQSTDSEAEEDARIERSMGVIRKNAASRGSEGGTKYHCDV